MDFAFLGLFTIAFGDFSGFEDKVGFNLWEILFDFVEII